MDRIGEWHLREKVMGNVKPVELMLNGESFCHYLKMRKKRKPKVNLFFTARSVCVCACVCVDLKSHLEKTKEGAHVQKL